MQPAGRLPRIAQPAPASVDWIAMKTLLLASVACTACATVALAQQEPDTNAFDGSWSVTTQPSGGSRVDARLTLQNFAGTWQDAGAGVLMKAKACKGKRFPITVQASVQSGLEFTVWGSAMSPACPDIGVTVKPVSDKMLEGMTASGETLRMSRR